MSNKVINLDYNWNGVSFMATEIQAQYRVVNCGYKGRDTQAMQVTSDVSIEDIIFFFALECCHHIIGFLTKRVSISGSETHATSVSTFLASRSSLNAGPGA